MDRHRDVAVVGGGLAGLTAALKLRDAGKDVVLLEARDRFGGRTHTVPLDGSMVDFGGQWIGPDQHRMLELTRELGLETFPTHVPGRNVLITADRRIEYEGTIPRMSPLKLLAIQGAISALQRKVDRIDPSAPWNAKRAERLDRTTVAGWLARRVPDPTARHLISTALRVVFGAEAGEVSLLYMLSYTAAGGSLMNLVETEGGAQEKRVAGGTQAISLRLAERLGDQAFLSAPVRRISQGPDHLRVATDRQRWSAREVVIAMAPAMTALIDFDPPLAGQRTGLGRRFPMGSTIKCHVFFDRPFWKEEGYSGEAVSTDGPVSVVYDNTYPDGRASLVAFVVGANAYRLSRASSEERKAIVIRELTRIFGDKALGATHYIDRDWGSDPWSGGCPTAFMTPGAMTLFGPELRRPVGHLHWAGTETSTEWCGYMEGAVASGERVARGVLEALDDGAPR